MMVRKLQTLCGGGVENRSPVVALELDDTPNVGNALDNEGQVLFRFGWRPFAKDYAGTFHLFIC